MVREVGRLVTLPNPIGDRKGAAVLETSTTRRSSAWVETLLSSAWADVLLATAVVLAVTGPLLFTSSGFELDFTNHLWLSSVAGRGLVEAGHPSYFINTFNPDTGVFYPYFVFEGGTQYTIIGGIGELIGGHFVIAYVGFIVLTVVGAYGGTLWLGREFGLQSWLAHAPALAVVTSAYYITNIYGRGDTPELIATSSIAPLAASAVHLVRAPRWRVLPVLVFAVSAVIFTGSHNLTLLLGTTTAAVTLLVMWLAMGVPWRLPYRRLAMVAGLGMACAMVNAWFLLPDIVYGENTVLGISPANYGQSIWPGTGFFDTPAVLLDPLRTVPRLSGTPALYVQAPDWFLAWGLAAGALLLLRSSRARELRRAWAGAVVVVMLLLGILLVEQAWEVMPEPINQIQFPYRFNTYLFYAVAGLVLVGALALQRVAASEASAHVVKGLRLALVGACAVSLGLCLWQQWVPNVMISQSYTNRSEALVGVHNIPKTWYTGALYYMDRLERVVIPPPKRLLLVYPNEVHGDRFSSWMKVPPGPEPIDTDIGGSSELVQIEGLRRLGRDSAGFAVVGRVNGGSGPVHVTIETIHSPTVELGWLLSVLGVMVILAVLVYTRVHARRVRTGPLR
jgi:hypothetical protein